MKRALWLALLAWPLPAHVMSMSSGDLAVDGTRAHFELRMPLYEVAHVANPERPLLEHIRFAGARLVRSECRADAARDTYLCVADYEFGAPVDRLDVECTFTAITVPNHVHLLRATLGEKRDEAIFDLGFTRATLRFRPPLSAATASAPPPRSPSRRPARAPCARSAAWCRCCSWRPWCWPRARAANCSPSPPCSSWGRRPAYSSWRTSYGRPRRESLRPRRRRGEASS